MLQYVAEGIANNKADGLPECIVSHYYQTNFRTHPKEYGSYHDITQKHLSFSDFTIVTVTNGNYTIIFWFMTITEAVDRMRNADDLNEKGGQL